MISRLRPHSPALARDRALGRKHAARYGDQRCSSFTPGVMEHNTARGHHARTTAPQPNRREDTMENAQPRSSRLTSFVPRLAPAGRRGRLLAAALAVLLAAAVALLIAQPWNGSASAS